MSIRLTKNQKALLESMPLNQWIDEKRAEQLEKRANTSCWFLFEKGLVAKVVVWGFPFETPEDRLVAQILHKQSHSKIFYWRLQKPLESDIWPRADFYKTDDRIKGLGIQIEEAQGSK